MGRKATKSAPSGLRSTWSVAVAAAVVIAGVLVWVYFAPEDPQQLCRAARLVIDSNPQEAAILAQRAIVAAGTDFPEAQLLWCRALGNQQRWSEALECFNYIKEPQQCDTEELLELTAKAVKANQADLAKQAFQASEPLGPQHADILPGLVTLLHREQDFAEVLRLCDRWRTLDPSDARPLEAAADVHRRRSELAKATEAYRDALKLSLSPKLAYRIRSELAGILIELGQVGPARKEMDHLLQDGTPDAKLRLKHANLLRIERRWEDSLAELQHLLSVDGDMTGALMLRGILHLDMGEFDKARDDLERVVSKDPYNKEAHYKLSQALLRLNRPEEAEEHLEISNRLTAAATEALNLVSRADGKPIDQQRRQRLAELYEQLGKRDLAEHWRGGN